MHVNFYKKPQIHVNNSHSKIGNGVSSPKNWTV